jgi:hypothetical protein
LANAMERRGGKPYITSAMILNAFGSAGSYEQISESGWQSGEFVCTCVVDMHLRWEYREFTENIEHDVSRHDVMV